MSCNFMPCKFVRQFHVLLFHVRHFQISAPPTFPVLYSRRQMYFVYGLWSRLCYSPNLGGRSVDRHQILTHVSG